MGHRPVPRVIVATALDRATQSRHFVWAFHGPVHALPHELGADGVSLLPSSDAMQEPGQGVLVCLIESEPERKIILAVRHVTPKP